MSLPDPYRLPSDHWALWVWVHLDPDFREFASLIDFTDTALREALRQHESSANQAAERFRGEYPADHLLVLATENMPNVARGTFDTYRRYLIYALVSTLNSLIEAAMIDICRSVAGLRSAWNKRDNPPNSVFDWFKTYTKRLGLSIPSQGRAWQELKRLNSLRHVVVHAEGRATAPLIAYSKTCPQHLRIDEDGRVVVAIDYLHYAVQEAETFFREFQRRNADRFTTGDAAIDQVLRVQLLGE